MWVLLASNFILCYDVDYDDKYKNEMKFKKFRMKIATEYVWYNPWVNKIFMFASITSLVLLVLFEIWKSKGTFHLVVSKKSFSAMHHIKTNNVSAVSAMTLHSHKELTDA